MWDALREWFLGLGAQYGVDPILFGAIYVGAIPFFTICLAWTVRNLRRKQSAALPAFLTGFFFLSAYLYLLVAGQNIPVWVYALIAALILFGAWSTVRKVRAKLADDDGAYRSPGRPELDSGSPGDSHEVLNRVQDDN